QDLWDRIVNGTDFPGDNVNTVIKPVDVFICPSDTDVTSVPDNAGLSYVANAGTWDYVENASDFRVGSGSNPTINNFLVGTSVGPTKDNGLFMNLTATNIPVRLSNIKDGAGTTLMLSENIHKNTNYNWLGAADDQAGQQQFGFV